MLTAVDNSAWVGASASSDKPRLKVWPYSLARPQGAFLAAELILLSFALLQTAWEARCLGSLILIACCALFFHINSLDKSVVNSRASQFWIDLLESVALGVLSCWLLFYLFPSLAPQVGLTLAAAILVSLLPVVLRMSLLHLVARGKFIEEILIVGTGDLPAKLRRELDRSVGHTKRNAQVLSLSTRMADRGGAVDLCELTELVTKDQISHVVIAESDPQNRERLAGALLDARLRGLQVSDAVDFYEEFSGKVWVEAVNPQWFVYTNGFRCSSAGLCLKRCFDVTFALLLIVLAAPLLAAIAIAIKLDSNGPVLFRQLRVGLHGKPFMIYKFRSMRHDGPAEAAPTWTSESDERVTRVGHFLRSFRLDEIPQAVNVLAGDMSIVGPRPERPCFVDRLQQEVPFYNLRHYLKPGITGWAQVMFKYGASVGDSYEKLQYDFHYARHRSVGRDLLILLKTVRIVLFGRGR